jgi:DNA-binding transcriptional ArsR family regulator
MLARAPRLRLVGLAGVLIVPIVAPFVDRALHGRSGPIILNRMVKLSPTADPLDAVFSALADPTRRAIVVRLSEGEASVSELAAPFDVSLPAVTKHLAVLERAGLLEHNKEGRVRRCRLVPAPMKVADDWLSTYRVFWERRLDSLADHFNPVMEAT